MNIFFNINILVFEGTATMSINWVTIPAEIKECIIDFVGEKQQIKKYFMNYIACYIDITLRLVPHGCEFCYIDILKKRKIVFCYACHQKIPIEKSKKKIFSATTLLTGKQERIYTLYYALNDTNRFLDLLAESNWSSNHPLSWLHYELLHKIRKIE